MEPQKVRPFLRWAGGKQYLLQYLLQFLPTNYKEVTYFEPFLGAGTLFWAISPPKAFLSDMNSHLIDCYKDIRDYPTKLHHYLNQHRRNNSKKYYYKIRDQFNKYLHSKTIAQSGRFIYLNRSCFNGIFRVNTAGQFNVPFAPKKNIIFPTLHGLNQYSKLLGNAKLESHSYEQILPKSEHGDFIYLDPPYPPLNGTSYFTHYTKDRFPIADQEKVADFAKALSNKGCKVMITNADVTKIRKLYKDWDTYTVEVTRFITCKTKRQKVNEIIIKNY